VRGDRAVLYPLGQQTVIQQTQATLEPVDRQVLIERATAPWWQGGRLRCRTTITPAKVRKKILGHWLLSFEPPRARRAPAGGRDAGRVGVLSLGAG